MYEIVFNWKESNVNLKTLENHMRSTYPNYVGCSAGADCKLHFSSEPSEQEKSDIQAFWDALDNSGYASQEQIQAAIAAMKAGMINKTFDQLSVGEKKLLLGLMPSNEELGL